MSVVMEWLIVIAFLFVIFVFARVLMLYLITTFNSKESVVIDTPEEALEKKVFDDEEDFH